MAKQKARHATRRKPTLEALRALVALAETSKVSEVARQLDVSQPVISRKIQVFEDAQACGAPLLRRNGQQLVLTESAWAVLPAVRELIQRYDQILDYLGGIETAPRLIRLGAGSFAAEHYLPQALAALRDELEECRVQAQICRGRERIVRTARGQLDLAIVTHTPQQVRQTLLEAAPGNPELEILRLGRHPMCVIAKRGSREGGEIEGIAPARAVPVSMLAQWELVGPDRESGLRRQLEDHFPSTELFFAAEGGGWAAAKEYVRHNLGVGIVPHSVIRQEDRKQLVVRRLAKEFSVTDYLIHRPGELHQYLELLKQAVIRAVREFEKRFED